jgi:predicted transcriptional regulator
MAEEVLELETRRDIYDLVRRVPGLHMREIQRRLDLSIALAEYHLNLLEESGIVVSIVEEGYRRYFPAPGDVDGRVPGIGGQERRIVGVLRQPIALRITLLLLTREGATHSEMSDYFGVSPSRLSFHLKKLVKHGVVRKLKRGEGKGYVIQDRNRILRLLIAYRPPPDMLDECADLWGSLSL